MYFVSPFTTKDGFKVHRPREMVVFLEYDKRTFLFFRSLRAAKSSGESEGTLVTIPVPATQHTHREVRSGETHTIYTQRVQVK